MGVPNDVEVEDAVEAFFFAVVGCGPIEDAAKHEADGRKRRIQEQNSVFCILNNDTRSLIFLMMPMNYVITVKNNNIDPIESWG